MFDSFTEILQVFSKEVFPFDVRSKITSSQMRVESQMFRFPNKIRVKWEKHFLTKVNQSLLNEFNAVKPDAVFIYNSEYLLPETCEIMKKSAKLVFLMGDSPFYTPVNNYYLTLLKYADLILASDSFWLEQLNTLGIHKTCFFVPPIETRSYFKIDKRNIGPEISETEMLYVGMCYVNSWGYKKALLMNNLAKHDIKIYGGSAWIRWFKYFPELESKFTLSNYIETTKLNKMFNKTKVIPVDGNPAIINGMHVRAIEVMGSGALPLIEYRKDVEEIIFKGFGKELPLIRDYSKAADVAGYYLKNDSEREDLALKMKDFFNAKYTIKSCADLIVDQIKRFEK